MTLSKITLLSIHLGSSAEFRSTSV